jgi:hypothetical protein
MVPERVRLVGLTMATGPNTQIKSMTSQATLLLKVMKVPEVMLTAIFVFLSMPNLLISQESLETIVHVMGITRVNAFSVIKKDDTIATGLYFPSNFINHSCHGNNCRPVTESMS